MYHETTYEDERRAKRRLVSLVVAFVMAIALTWAGLRLSRVLTREQGAQALREAVVVAARQCCAIEGSYPTTLDYLTDHYGLVVNERDYVVTYEWLGDNIAPSVVVRSR